VNAPGDAFEQAADAVADQVLRMSDLGSHEHHEASSSANAAGSRRPVRPRIQRLPSGQRGCDKVAFDLAADLGSGRPLDSASRAYFEPRFGHDFGQVRVHDGPEAAKAAAAVGARAFTLGRDVVFANGENNPRSKAGKRLLAHELTHVVQQDRAGANRGMVQRQQIEAGAESATEIGVPGVASEKWRPDVEATYRRAGLTEAADAVRRCRETRSCMNVLTESEAYTAYRGGRLQAGISDPGAMALAGAVAPRLVQAGAATSETALETAAVRWGEAAILQGGAGAGAGEAAAVAPAATAGTVLIPLAVGAYVTVAVVDLVGYASFQVALRDLGYVVLPAPLGVCIGMCHQRPVPREPQVFPPIPRAPTFSPRISREELARLSDWVNSSSSTAPGSQPTAVPVPVPQPQDDEERRRRCRIVRRAVPRGNDPLSELFCSIAMPGAASHDIYSPAGVAEIDALAGRTWYECKCGYGSLVRATHRGERWARFALDTLDEQIRRHMRIAAVCRLRYRFVVSREDVAELVRSRHRDVDVMVVSWEPCE
jgi:hypothetical protein